MHWIYLAIAIATEVVATTALKASDGFTRTVPSAVTVLGYGVSFYCLSLTLKTLPIGIVYAIWSGAGIIAISVIGYLVFRQTLDTAAMIGIGLIVTGVVILNAFSKSVVH